MHVKERRSRCAEPSAKVCVSSVCQRNLVPALVGKCNAGGTYGTHCKVVPTPLTTHPTVRIGGRKEGVSAGEALCCVDQC